MRLRRAKDLPAVSRGADGAGTANKSQQRIVKLLRLRARNFRAIELNNVLFNRGKDCTDVLHGGLQSGLSAPTSRCHAKIEPPPTFKGYCKLLQGQRDLAPAQRLTVTIATSLALAP